MQIRRSLALAVACALAACQRTDAPAASEAPGAAPATPIGAAPATEVATGPYTYQAPVDGRIEEINAGKYDLVDGLAYPDTDGEGTVIMALSKSIASPTLTDARCLVQRMQALALIRNASFAEVTVDADGVSPYFAYGRFTGVGGRDTSPPESEYWRIDYDREGDRAEGSVTHKSYGHFTFDLPVHAQAIPPDSLTPDAGPMLESYRLIRTAVLAGDLVEALRVQGFTPAQIDAFRRLPGVEGDFAAFRERFPEPGTPDADSVRPGDFYAGGKTLGGKEKWIRYGFVQCADWLVLSEIIDMDL